MIEEVLNVLFPERCIECGKTGSVLCAICERAITTKPLALSGTTASLFDYRNPLVKKAIWSLKYRRRRSLGKYFGTALYREFFKQLSHTKNKGGEEIFLVPVPASAKAVKSRGYNHAGLIAKTIARAGADDGLKLSFRDDMLYKNHEVGSQAKTPSRTRRIQNVSQVFTVRNGDELIGKTVILVDDVITTGATVADARRALLEFKPRRILAIAVAH